MSVEILLRPPASHSNQASRSSNSSGIGLILVLDVSGGSGREELVNVDTVPEDAGTGPLGSPNP